ncbi:MAG: hypothetical protein AAFX06_28280 [Planctomycetota bacterium]
MLPASVDLIAFDANGRRTDVAASITGRVTVDGGAWSDLSGDAEHQGNGVYRITLTTTERVSAARWSFDGASSTAGVSVLPAPVAENVITGATIKLVSPYSIKTKRLELVERADYTAGSATGPIRVLVELAGVSVGDEVRFGATLPIGEGTMSIAKTIRATGAVVDVNGDLFAEVELTNEDTDKTPSPHWRWELEHVSGSGDVSPLVIDAEMTLHPSHAEAV